MPLSANERENRLETQTASVGSVAGSTALVMRPGNVRVYVAGTFVATYAVEASNDNGTTWAVAISDATVLQSLTAPRSIILREPVNQIRLNVTAYTSGTVVLTTEQDLAY